MIAQQEPPAVLKIRCDNCESCRDKQPWLHVPRHMLASGQVEPIYWNREFSGFFVSEKGGVFCSRECWARLCGD